MASKKFLFGRGRANAEDLKTHILEAERRQQHPRTQPVLPASHCDGSLTTWALRIGSQRLPHPQHYKRPATFVSDTLPFPMGHSRHTTGPSSSLSPTASSSGASGEKGENTASVAAALTLTHFLLGTNWYPQAGSHSALTFSQIVQIRRTCLLHGGFKLLFVKSTIIRFLLTDLSASNPIGMIFQGYIGEQNSSFLQSQFSFLDLVTTRQLHLHRHLADFIISNVTVGASKYFPSVEACRLHFCLLHHFLKSFPRFQQLKQIFNFHSNVSSQIFRLPFHRLTSPLWRTVTGRTQPSQKQNSISLQLHSNIGSISMWTPHNLIGSFSGAADFDNWVKFKPGNDTLWLWDAATHYPPSLNDWHLPINLFNVITPVSPAPVSEPTLNTPEFDDVTGGTV